MTGGAAYDSHREFRPPTDPEKIRPERRPPVLVNSLGSGPTLLREQLDTVHRRLFDAQLAAFLAAEALSRFASAVAAYGVPAAHDPYDAWDEARFYWEMHTWEARGQRRGHRE